MNVQSPAARLWLKGRIFGLLAVCWSLAVTVPSLYAGGKTDGDLSRADRLIADKQYDEAILLLSEHVRNNPGDFTAAQKRLQQIVKFRGEYNAVADELLSTVSGDPGNAQKILALINQLQSIESPNSPQVQAFISRVRAIALFTYNRNRLEQILNTGREALARGNYQEAVTIYAGGLDIYQDEFFTSGYGDEMENRVRTGIADLRSEIGGFPALIRSVEAGVVEEMERAASQNSSLSHVTELYRRLLPGLDNLVRSREAFLSVKNSFDEDLGRLKADEPGIGDRSFLSFASRLIRGPSQAAFPEGMLGAVEGYWNSVMSRVEGSVLSLAEQNYAAARTALASGNYAAAAASYSNSKVYFEFLHSFAGKWREFRYDSRFIALFEEQIPEEKFGDFLAYQAYDNAAAYLEQGADLGRRFDEIPDNDTLRLLQAGSITSAEAERREEQFRAEFTGLSAATGTLLGEVNGKGDQFRGIIEEAAVNLSGDPLSPIEEARVFTLGLLNRIGQGEYNATVGNYTMANGDFEKRLNDRRDEIEEGGRLIQGIAGENGISHYPAEALAILERMNTALAADVEAGDTLLKRYSGERRETLDREEISGLYASAQAMMGDLVSLRTRGQALAASARTQASQAETYRQDGDRLFREAQGALTQNNFDTARDRLNRSMERYNASLEIQESASLRAEWDGRIVGLGNEINRIENEFVIRDVRNFVTAARTNYYAGNFEQAEEQLVRAQNRWRRTNAADDDEVLYWLSLVRNAMSLRSGRVIPTTAPLYPEMSQLLSEARKSYEEGVRHFDANMRQEGVVKFTEARQKTQEVKIMFPLNEDAGILELRMDQVTDPRAFEASFAQRLATAVAGTKRRSAEAFADIQNLAKINPRYPGIAGIITQAEIDMGYRPPPPNPADLARSAELTNDARRVIEGNLSGQYDAALIWLDQALRLNPNNTEATRQKDILLTRTSGRGVIVLDRKTEDEYQTAVRELQQGNYLGAYARVERLLQDPRNQNSTLILDLRRRIQSQL
jgi:tetratricopeptide (TPR) repeat protein